MRVENVGHEEAQRIELCLGVKPKIFENHIRGKKKKKKVVVAIESKYWSFGSKEHERLLHLYFVVRG